MNVKIVDAHMHIWDLEKVNISWLNKNAGILYDSFTPEKAEVLLHAINVSEAILVQSDNSFEDSAYMFEQSTLFDWISGVVAWLPLENPQMTHKKLNDYLNEPFFKGIRHLMHIETDDNWILKETVIESLHMLANENITFDAIGINNKQLKSIIQAGEKVPHLRMVIDHLNQPPVHDQKEMDEWNDFIKVASSNPNMHIKISGLGTMKRMEGKSMNECFLPVLYHILKVFGTERIFCGGDWPISLIANNYLNTWSGYLDMLSNLLNDQRSIENILYWNAKKFYNT